MLISGCLTAGITAEVAAVAAAPAVYLAQTFNDDLSARMDKKFIVPSSILSVIPVRSMCNGSELRDIETVPNCHNNR